jgi:hypothetical protein
VDAPLASELNQLLIVPAEDNLVGLLTQFFLETINHRGTLNKQGETPDDSSFLQLLVADDIC